MEKKLKDIVFGVLASIEKEERNLFDLILSVNADRFQIVDRDITDFWIWLVYPYEEFLKHVIWNRYNCQDNANFDKLVFLLTHTDYVQQHYESLIIKYEEGGSICCADKSSSIIKKLSHLYQNKEIKEWNFNQEYTYHFPTKIFTTNEQITTFFDAIFDLFYGNFDKYFEWHKTNLETLNK